MSAFLDAMQYQAQNTLERCVVTYLALRCGSDGVVSFDLPKVADWCVASEDEVNSVIVDLMNLGVFYPVLQEVTDVRVWKLNFKVAV